MIKLLTKIGIVIPNIREVLVQYPLEREKPLLHIAQTFGDRQNSHLSSKHPDFNTHNPY